MDHIRICADQNANRRKVIEVVAALLTREERFLLCQRAEGKARALGWEFPGGKIEPGETPQQALAREMMEEMSADIEAGEVVCDTVYAYPDVTVHLMLLHASMREGEPVCREHRDMRWVTLDEAKTFGLCPADRALIAQIG